MDLLLIVALLIVIYYAVYFTLPFILDCDILLAFKQNFGEQLTSLKGKVVWITGASSGIGEELAYVLARTGCKLILTARRTTELERVKRKCLEENKDLTNNDVEVYPLDILQLDLHENAFNHVIYKFGKLDILVNNAGRSQRAQWENIDIEVDKEMFDLNVFPVLSLSRIAVKYFLQVGGGHIVVTSSVAGIQPVPKSATYCGTKHALHGYFKSLKMEHPNDNIDVTMVCPGPVQTNFLAECFTEKPNQKYGVKTEVSWYKISAKRCADLMAIAIVNKLDEVWIAKPPVMRILYLLYVFPNLGIWILRSLGARYFMKLRDSGASNKGLTDVPDTRNN